MALPTKDPLIISSPLKRQYSYNEKTGIFKDKVSEEEGITWKNNIIKWHCQ
jgi:hypothetical protein